MSHNDIQRSETIPKVLPNIVHEQHLVDSDSRSSSQVEIISKQHSCLPRSQQRRKSDQQQSLFINSLMAPKKFINQITIEPLAFLAILSLYIEFPAIQDLIYTKICLQVVADHPSLDSPQLSPFTSPNATYSSPNSTLPISNRRLERILNSSEPEFFKTIDITQNRTQPGGSSATPPAKDGRIQMSQTTQAPIALDRLFQTQPSSKTSEIVKPLDNHLICNRLNKTAVPKAIRQEIAAANSLFWLKYQIVICLLCALSCPYWGGMSDRIGRLIPLNVPIVAAMICNLISLIFGLMISLKYHSTVSINWLYLGAVLVGLSGGQTVVMVNSFSFISDNSSVESRSKRVTVLESVVFISHSAGFYINQHIMTLHLVPWYNRHFVAFTACIILNFSCLLYSIFKLRHHNFHRFLNNFEREQNESFNGDLSARVVGGSFNRLDPRSLSNDCYHGQMAANTSDRFRELTSSTPDDLDGPVVRSDKRWTGWSQVLTFTFYKQTYLTATKPRDSRTMILLLLLCGFISALCVSSMLSLLYIYLRMDPFNWTTSQYSWWNSVTSMTRGVALVSLTLCMKFIKNWNVPDPLVAGVGFISRGAGLLMIATAQSSAIVNWSLLALVLSEFTTPPIRSLLSKLVIKEEVGKVYSCLGAMQMLCFLLGNVLFYLGYTSFELNTFFKFSFLFVAVLQFLASVIMLFVYTSLRKRVILI